MVNNSTNIQQIFELTTILTQLFTKLLTITMLIENYKDIRRTITMISIYSIKMRVEAFRRIIRALKD